MTIPWRRGGLFRATFTQGDQAIRTIIYCLCLLLAGIFACFLLGRWIGHQSTTSQDCITSYVLSGSMAPAIHGPAWSMPCPSCGVTFLFDRHNPGDIRPDEGNDALLATDLALPRPFYNRRVTFPLEVCCPNCGTIQSDQALTHVVAVEQTIVIAPRQPGESAARDAVIVAKVPPGSQRYIIKRVVGLPGEQIAIYQGDLYINGKLRHKEFADVADWAIPVHTESTRRPVQPGPVQPTRWQLVLPAESSGLPRQAIERSASSEAMAGPEMWWEYVHSPSLPRPYRKGTPGPIKDTYGYNQHLSRTLHDVRDVWLRMHWKPVAGARIWMKFRDGTGGRARLKKSDALLCMLDATKGQAVLRMADHTMRYRLASPSTSPSQTGILPIQDTTAEPSRLDPSIWQITWGVLDGRVGLSVNGQAIFMEPLLDQTLPTDPDRMALPFSGNARPLAVGVEPVGENLADAGIVRLDILRDVYRTLPANARGPVWHSRKIGPGEVMLLGDNCPASLDARQQDAMGYVSHDAVLGTVIRKSTLYQEGNRPPCSPADTAR